MRICWRFYNIVGRDGIGNDIEKEINQRVCASDNNEIMEYEIHDHIN